MSQIQNQKLPQQDQKGDAQIQQKQGENEEEAKDNQNEKNQEKNLQIHQLNDKWQFWYTEKLKRSAEIPDSENYLQQLKNIATVGTLEEFFSVYCYIQRPSELEVDQKIMLFRQNSPPLWENYAQGGSWIIVMTKKEHCNLNLAWENILCALIGEQFEDFNIIGAMLQIRYKKNLIELWLNNYQVDKDYKMKIVEKLSYFMNTDFRNANFYFKDHASSLSENSNIKNAEQYKFILTPLAEPIEGQNNEGADGDDLDTFTLDQK